MKKIPLIIMILLLVQVPACVNDPEIRLEKAEVWTNLMPGAEGKTHFILSLRVYGTESDQYEITGMTVKYEDEDKRLSKEEFDYKQEKTDEYIEITINGAFAAGSKDLQKITAWISFLFDGEETVYKTDEIKVEKVY
jgi:hypothetical protein